METPSRPRRLLLSLLLLVLPSASCGDAGTTGPGGAEPGPDGPELRGTLHSVGGGSVEGLWAVWRVEGGASADSARVRADGTFRIQATTEETEGELLVTEDDSGRFHPMLLPFDAGDLDGVDLLAIPRRWTIRAGVHAGEVVATPLDPAVEDDARNYRYTYFFGQPHPRDDPERYLLDLLTWPRENLPARVAVDHAESTAAIAPSDSAAIWRVLEGMEEATGLDLFEPVEARDGWWDDPDGPEGEPFEPGVIRVVHDPPSWRGLPQGREDPRVHDGGLGSWASRGPFQAFRERHRRLSGGLLVVGAFEPLRLSDGFIPWETVLVHEMLHVLGLGHTCRIPSPMGPCMRTPGVSAHDVAYMELLRETLRLARELDALHGMMPSVIGERRILLGASALPELEG